MKTRQTLAAVLLALAFAAPAGAEPYLHQHPHDYIAHAVVGSAIGYAVTEYTQTPAMGVLAAALVGVGKEKLHDQHTEPRDILATILGGIAGSAVSANLIITRHGVAWRQSW